MKKFDLARLPDPDSLTPEELRDLLAQLEDFYREVDAREPEDEESEEYDAWLEDLEEIQDLMDDLTDRLDG
jgi:hypothetical protein